MEGSPRNVPEPSELSLRPRAPPSPPPRPQPGLAPRGAGQGCSVLVVVVLHVPRGKKVHLGQKQWCLQPFASKLGSVLSDSSMWKGAHDPCGDCLPASQQTIQSSLGVGFILSARPAGHVLSAAPEGQHGCGPCPPRHSARPAGEGRLPGPLPCVSPRRSVSAPSCAVAGTNRLQLLDVRVSSFPSLVCVYDVRFFRCNIKYKDF